VGQGITLLAATAALAGCGPAPRGTGDLGLMVERASGRIHIIETTDIRDLGTVDGLGDLSHASAVFSRDGRYAFIFGRDGGLTKVDLLSRRIVKRILQAGNSIGGAISQDGRLIAMSNYQPGGVRVFDSRTLAPVADIPARFGDQGKLSKVVGLVDAPDNRFVFSLFDAGEIWIADFAQAGAPKITRFRNVGRQPYDGLITPDGRYYIAGLFGEDGLALIDLWHPERGVRRILGGYGRGTKRLPVFKMTHLEGWALAGGYAFLPEVGHHEILVADARTWTEVARIPVHSQPVFAVARPDGRQVWVNFAHPDNDVVQVIDVDSLKVIKTLTLGPAVLHLEFTPRGEQVWISVRDRNVVDVFDTRTFTKLASLPANKPSGIFLAARANRIGL